ncbi:unnamed protein product [Kuraishia capsulata CBS 1993]|uniref:Amino acid transporter transmembrane domain-containing protein n=1 Tax=Kuraishia capsulata CBS 1993 TaxID=1382522 RepID=W6MMT5_9ASCO|nr:uncharacterized protein KUCA_T00002273001 [Kuraishia capsulata CBS 1993]CDK26302.1 unnamed protein product [Kuraishia capsulata CBS 1993]
MSTAKNIGSLGSERTPAPGDVSESFQNGDFSAKHMLKRSVGTRSAYLRRDDGVTSDVLASNPITIAGGFAPGADGANLAIPSSLAAKSSGPQSRRQSMLSSIISTTPRYPQPVSAPQEVRPPSVPVSVQSSVMDVENPEPEVVRAVGRHLVGESPSAANSVGTDRNFDSLRLQGGDMTRGIYNWYAGHERQEGEHQSPLKRSTSVGQLSSDDARDEGMSVTDMQVPGGFRRSFLLHKAPQLDVEAHPEQDGTRAYNRRLNQTKKPEGFLARNFIEFLAVYGHFAGEDLRENGEDSDAETNSSEVETEDGEDDDSEIAVAVDEEQVSGSSERRPRFSLSRTPNYGSFGSTNGTLQLQQQQLLLSANAKLRKKRSKARTQKTETSNSKKVSNHKATLLLLKAFIGTGVVFLPKSFSNGGLLFCNVMLLIFSFVSYYCFVILVGCTTSTGVRGYGELGEKLFGPAVKLAILASLVMSQLGFSSAYTVFVAENLQSLANTLFKHEGEQGFTIEFFIVVQLVIFVPLSLTRQISKLSATALIADVFILAGLVYIVYCSSFHLAAEGISNKISMFKSETWTLFVGTAVFAFEGIGLLIPVKESMARPQDFEKVLFFVMVVVTVVFTSIATVSYMSYGDDVKTVILLNFKPGVATEVVQFLYAAAILLSTPLQLFPAIKIIENYFFSQHRQTWQKKIRRESEASSFSNGLYPTSSPQKLLLPTGSNLINQEGILSGKSDTAIKWTKNLVRLMVVMLMCLISYTGSNDLDKFVSLIGSFTCVPLIYIYPPLLYMKANDLSARTWYFSGTVAVFGVVLMVYTSYQTISSWILA